MDKARTVLAELREHWDDGYWWADRQILLYAILFGIWFFANLALLIASSLLEKGDQHAA